MQLLNNIELSDYNTFGIKVKAKYFIKINDVEDLPELREIIKYSKEKYIILGEGSNVLFTKDYNGIVIKNEIKGIELIKEIEENYFVKIYSGESWKNVISYAVKNEYYGIENLSEIPGTMGAAPVQNIGAYGVEIKDVLVEVEYFDIDSSEIKILKVDECEFGYRESIFKKSIKNAYIISVTLKLNKAFNFQNEYQALNQELNKRGISNPTIKDIYIIVKEIRESKLPDYKIYGNAGSFFKNPVVEIEQFNLIKNNYSDVVSYKIDEKFVKIPAGWLIEKAGFKGKKINNVGCFEKQALVIVNYGNATGEDILNYATQVISKVKELFNIELTNEVNIL